MHRDQEAVAAFDAGPLKDDAEAGLWRALAEQRLGRNGQALLGFRRAEALLDRYPQDLQGEFRAAMARAALAMQDMSVAEREIHAFGELPRDGFDQDKLALLRAMLDDASGRPEAAIERLQAALRSEEPPRRRRGAASRRQAGPCRETHRPDAGRGHSPAGDGLDHLARRRPRDRGAGRARAPLWRPAALARRLHDRAPRQRELSGQPADAAHA